MEDLDILRQLYSGLHLESKDLERASKLVHGLGEALKRRVI